VPKAVAIKRAQLIKNCQGFSKGVEKFSLLHSNSVAAARSPTTAGRKPVNIDCTNGVFMYFINILLISIISINDGSTKAKVAVAEPRIAIRCPYPALCIAVYPQ
jgi:hypothetical protein